MNVFDKLVGVITEKDLNSTIIECNNNILAYAKANSKDDIIGKTDHELPWHEFADLYRAHEEDAIAGKHYSAIMPIKIYNGDIKLFLHTKVSNLDENGKVKSILCRAVEIINPNMYKLAQAISVQTNADEDTLYIGKNTDEYKLSKRQEETLFLLIRGKSAKSIARILNISPRTVEYYIEIIKHKFHCHSKQALIDKVINSDFSKLIPMGQNIENLLKKLND